MCDADLMATMTCDIGGQNDGSLRVCCSTHQKTLCNHHYCRTHFNEVDPAWMPEFACNAEGRT